MMLTLWAAAARMQVEEEHNSTKEHFADKCCTAHAREDFAVDRRISAKGYGDSLRRSIKKAI
jgi:hypothetical protein